MEIMKYFVGFTFLFIVTGYALGVPVLAEWLFQGRDLLDVLAERLRTVIFFVVLWYVLIVAAKNSR